MMEGSHAGSHPALVEHIAQLTERGYNPVEIERLLAADVSPAQLGQARRQRLKQEQHSRQRSSRDLITQSGRIVSLEHPSPSSFHLEDIAHGLSAICRFSGQTRHFYSVAEHSLMVASMVPAELRLRALLHDATEAYIQDLPSPLKAMLPGYVAIESRLWTAIAKRFGLAASSPIEDAAVNDADRAALLVELRDLFDQCPAHLAGQKPPAGYAIAQPLSPHRAKQAFIDAVEVAIAA